MANFGWITGRHRANAHVDTECEEDYCDLGEIVNESQFDFIGELEGEVESGRWEWNGEGSPRYLTNSVTQLVAY